MRGMVLVGALASLLFAQGLKAQETLEFRYDPEKQPSVGGKVVIAGENIVYTGYSMPMKLCAKDGDVVVRFFTPGTIVYRYDYILKTGECRFASPIRISLQSKSKGTLTISLVPNVQIAPAPPLE